MRFLLVLFTLLLSHSVFAQDSLERINPVDAGFSADSLAKLTAFLETSGTSSFMLLHDGKVFFEWGDIYKKHTIHSIRKAMLNSIVGIYVDRGVIDTSKTLAELGFDDFEPALNEQEKQVKLADILKSRSGIYIPSAAESAGMEASRPPRGSSKAGESYYYNNWDFNTAGYIFEKLTGKKIYDAYLEEIAKPLGMQQFKGEHTRLLPTDDFSGLEHLDGFYQYEPEKTNIPAYHFRMSAHDMALYGSLYLNKGEWKGKQIISKEWIEASTKSYSITNSYMDFGYGMLWYTINKNENRASSSFYHTGVGIHMLAVYPGSKVVLVHRVDTENEYNFPQDNLYEIIGLVWAAEVK